MKSKIFSYGTVPAPIGALPSSSVHFLFYVVTPLLNVPIYLSKPVIEIHLGPHHGDTDESLGPAIASRQTPRLVSRYADASRLWRHPVRLPASSKRRIVSFQVFQINCPSVIRDGPKFRHDLWYQVVAHD